MSLGHTFAIYGNNDALTSTDNYASASASADNVTAPPVIPDGCFAAVSDISPGVEPTKGISASSLKVLEIIVYLGAMPVLTLVGCVTNTLSCVVFYRLGVKKGINLCLLLLSASDLLFLLSQTAVRSSRVMLTLTASARGISQWEYTVVTFHLLRKCAVFLFFSNFLTTLASLERCVSIVSPLKARHIFTFRTVVVLIIAAFIVDVVSFVAIGFKHRVVCLFDVEQNLSLWGIGASSVYLNNKLAFNTFDNLLLVLGFPALSLFVVIISTTIIIHRLNVATKWRRQTSSAGSGGSGGAGVSKSETQLHKMLIVVSCIHVVCTLPSILKDASKFFVPGFNVSGNYSNVFNAIIALKDMSAGVNCTVNFFVYYSLGSQFRLTVNRLLGRFTGGNEMEGRLSGAIIDTPDRCTVNQRVPHAIAALT